MCINPLHKLILSKNTVIKGDALKTLACLNIPEAQNLVISTLKKVITDKSPYVRRIACLSLMKIVSYNREEYTEE
jgi:vesicle coat complex subunit